MKKHMFTHGLQICMIVILVTGGALSLTAKEAHAATSSVKTRLLKVLQKQSPDASKKKNAQNQDKETHTKTNSQSTPKESKKETTLQASQTTTIKEITPPVVALPQPPPGLELPETPPTPDQEEPETPPETAPTPPPPATQPTPVPEAPKPASNPQPKSTPPIVQEEAPPPKRSPSFTTARIAEAMSTIASYDYTQKKFFDPETAKTYGTIGYSLVTIGFLIASGISKRILAML